MTEPLWLLLFLLVISGLSIFVVGSLFGSGLDQPLTRKPPEREPESGEAKKKAAKKKSSKKNTKKKKS